MLLIVAATDPELRGAEALTNVVRLACGVGPVEAAATTAACLAQMPQISAVLQVGIAGCRRASGIEIGSLVIGERSIFCDTASQLVARELNPDPTLLMRTQHALPSAAVTTIGTSADVNGSADCDVEAMEGFGVLLAATLAGVPALELRAVSNYIEDEDRSLWRFDTALDALADALPTVVATIASSGHEH